MISYTRRNPMAMLLAETIRGNLIARGHTVWLDVTMDVQNLSALKEGVVNSARVIAILTGPCVNPERPDDPPEDNAYLRRWHCMEDLLWATQAGSTIVPVVDQADKHKINDFLGDKGPDGFDAKHGAGTFKKTISIVMQQTVVDINRNHPGSRQAATNHVVQYLDTAEPISDPNANTQPNAEPDTSAVAPQPTFTAQKWTASAFMSAKRRLRRRRPPARVRHRYLMLPYVLNKPGTTPSTHVLNKPGHWDFMISHTSRNPTGKILAQDIRADLIERGYTVWLGMKMEAQSRAAVKEGVMNSKNVIAIVTGPGANPEMPHQPPEDNAYLRRQYCIEDLVWAKQAGVTIVPVVDHLDKPNIATLLSGIAPSGLNGMYGNATFEKIISSLAQQKVIDFKRSNETSRAYAIVRIIQYRSKRAERQVGSHHPHLTASVVLQHPFLTFSLTRISTYT